MNLNFSLSDADLDTMITFRHRLGGHASSRCTLCGLDCGTHDGLDRHIQAAYRYNFHDHLDLAMNPELLYSFFPNHIVAYILVLREYESLQREMFVKLGYDIKDADFRDTTAVFTGTREEQKDKCSSMDYVDPWFGFGAESIDDAARTLVRNKEPPHIWDPFLSNICNVSQFKVASLRPSRSRASSGNSRQHDPSRVDSDQGDFDALSGEMVRLPDIINNNIV
jgi:hypothetical protein